MPALNKIQLIGRLGKEPESRATAANRQVCVFTVAVDHRWKDKKGEVKSMTDWFNIEAWGKLGEVCQNYLHKGNLIFVEGRMKTDKFEREGETHYFTKVVLSNVQMLERRKSKEEEPHLISEEEVYDG